MADADTSQPVRTENDGDVVIKVCDATVPSQQMEVDNTGAAKVRAANFPSTVDTDYGAVGADTIRIASQAGNATGANDYDYGAVGAQTPRVAAQLGNATGANDYNNGATGAQTPRVAANLAVAGADVSPTNPIPVVFSVDGVGTEINDYNTNSSLAVNGVSNHDYTVTALKTLLLKAIHASSAGKMKLELQIETGAGTGIFNTRFVFWSSVSTPNIDITLPSAISVVAGAKVRLIRTNKDNQPTDVYSTISGQEVP